jgi:DNA-binding transcriptional LysR family regulator
METATVLEHAEGGAPLTLDFPPSISATNVGFAKELAVAGAGVALLPTLVVERDIEEGRLVRLLRPYVFRGASLYLLHRGGRLVPSKVRVFREFMIEEFRRRCGEAIAGKQNKV